MSSQFRNLTTATNQYFPYMSLFWNYGKTTSVTLYRKIPDSITFLSGIDFFNGVYVIGSKSSTRAYYMKQ